MRLADLSVSLTSMNAACASIPPAMVLVLGGCALMFGVPVTGAHAEEPPSNSPTVATALSSQRAVIATGGGTSSGGDFTIDGTIGQADADPLQPSTGGDFAITGGFWFTLAPAPNELFADGFEAP